jgi:hypothetical protein
MKKFSLEINNPPFQDSENRGNTQHKLWIDFLLHSHKTLEENGILAYVTPASFASPSSKVLKLMKEYSTKFISFDSKKHFEEEGNNPGSTFAHYIIQFTKDKNEITKIIQNECEYNINLNNFIYLPNDFSLHSCNIHEKVIFNNKEFLNVQYDYVTCHNVNLKKMGVNSHVQKIQTNECCHPLFHTNNQIWYSSVRQNFANLPKVMWSRSGYTKPFFDNGILGGTDMCYYILVNNEQEGINLQNNLNSKLFKYIFKTAKWSGFGNEIVFKSLPKLPNVYMSDNEVFNYFNITENERNYINTILN